VSHPLRVVVILQLDADYEDLYGADVLQRMGRQRLGPDDGPLSRSRRRGPSIEQHVTRGVPPDEVAPAEHVEHARPLVRMHGNHLAGGGRAVAVFSAAFPR